MKYIYTIILCSLALLTNAQEKAEAHELKEKNGKFYWIKSEKVFSGILIKYDAEAYLTSEQYYKEGKPDGKYFEYWYDGKIKKEEEYEQGIKKKTIPH